MGTIIAFAATSCGSSTGSSDPAGVPELSIDSLRADGLLATVTGSTG